MDIRKRRIEAYRSAGTRKNAGGEEKDQEPAAPTPEKQPGAASKPSPGKSSPERPESGRGGADDGFLRVAGGKQGYRKAAELLILIGTDEAAKVLSHLDREQIEGITREIASIDSIDAKEAGRILSEFGRLRERGPERRVEGGAAVARDILVRAFGEDTGTRVFKKVVPRTGQPFAFLADLDIQQIMFVLRGESSVVLAVILAMADPALSAQILTSLGNETRKDVMLRLSRMKKIDPSIIVKVEESLRNKIRSMGTVVSERVDGKSTLVEILRNLDSRSEQQILEGLKEKDAGLYADIRDRIFTADVVLQVEERSLQNALNDIDDTDLALFLKGKSDAIRRKILSNLSERRRAFVLEEYERLGGVKKSRVDDVTAAFLDLLKRKLKEGTLLIHDEDDPIVR